MYHYLRYLRQTGITILPCAELCAAATDLGWGVSFGLLHFRSVLRVWGPATSAGAISVDRIDRALIAVKMHGA